MVVFLDIVRKFTTKKLSQYLKSIEKMVFKQFVDGLPEEVDDDLRGLGALTIDRIGSADNLTVGKIITKSIGVKTIYEGGAGDCVLHLLMNDVNSPNQKDISGWKDIIDKSIILDGSNDYIDCTNDATLWSQAKTKFSFSIWVYFNSIDTGAGNRDIIRHDGTSNHRFVLELTGSNLSFNIKNSVGGVISATTPLSGLIIQKWYLITCVYDNSLGTENLKLYVDGVKLGTANLTDTVNLSGSLFLGGSPTSLAMDGLIKDFRWFGPTTALTQTQVEGLFKLSPDPVPNYWLPMTEGTGNPVDKISTTKVGTLTNGAAWQVIDRSKVISREGNPCVVKTAQDFIGRQEVGLFNGIDDGLIIADHPDLRISNNQIGLSIGYWLRVSNGADALKDGAFYDTKSLLFDGVNDLLDCGNHADLWSQSLTKFSISFWLRPTAGWDGNTRNVLTHGGSAPQGFRVLISPTVTGRITFRIVNAAGVDVSAINDTLVLNQWNFITCVYDNTLGSANLKIYINGVVGTNANLTEAINQSAILSLADSSNDLAGQMKEFKFYLKALSAEGVDAVYRGYYVNPDYHLPMNEGTGTITNDSKSAKTATLTNGLAWTTTNPYPLQANTIPKCIYNKYDDAGNQVLIYIDPKNKSLVVNYVNNGGNDMFRKEVDNMYVYDTWVFHEILFNNQTDTFTIYKNATSQTLQDTEKELFLDDSDTDGHIAHLDWFGEDTFSGIALYNFKIWRNRLLTGGEITNENTNKFTISNITAAERPIIGYCTINT